MVHLSISGITYNYHLECIQKQLVRGGRADVDLYSNPGA